MRSILLKSGSMAAALVLLAACCDCGTQPGKRTGHWRRSSTIATPKPEIISPKSHKTCVEDFGFKQGTPQYDKCVSSLSQIEAK